jgi:hypothetical protein
MHPQLHMLIAPEDIANMHRDAARARMARQASSAIRRSQRRPPIARIKIASERMTAPSAHAGARAGIPQPEGP